MFQSSLDTQSKPFYKSQHNQFLGICIVFRSYAQFIPRSYSRLQPSCKIWILVYANLKKRNGTFFTLVVFLLLASLSILGSYSTYNQENVDENISRKRHFLHVNRNS